MNKLSFLVYCFLILISGCLQIPVVTPVPTHGAPETSKKEKNPEISAVAALPAGENTPVIINSHEKTDPGQPVSENGKQEIGKTEGENRETSAGKDKKPTDESADTGHNPLQTENTEKSHPKQLQKSFNIKEALKQVTDYFKEPEYPVTNKGEVMFIMHDLNADEIPEILVPGIESKNPADADFEHISSFSRLFDAEKAKIKFNLYIFYSPEGVYTLFRKISLGYNQVFKSFSKLYGNTKIQDPVIIAAAFQTGDGTLYKWVLFKKPELKPISIFQFEETIFKQAVIKDIDDDDTIDVIIQEKSIEEGVGYETYLSWMKWNGKRFVEYKNINVVRNLNAFLARIRDLLIKGDINKLLSFAIDSRQLNSALKEGISKKDILENFFGISRETRGSSQSETVNAIANVIFPDILDNPFYLNDDKGFYFLLTYRIVYQDDVALIAETLLYMKKNPFGERQFMLIPAGNVRN